MNLDLSHNEPNVLDTFACKGGAGGGYRGAGGHVISVDNVDYSEAHPPGSFFQADAVEFILDHGHKFDLIHISAPCQFWTRGNARLRADGSNPWPRLIAAARDAAIRAGVPYVIENVEDAAAELLEPICLCGRMFGLHALDSHSDALGMMLLLDRHRLFEFGNMATPIAPAHPVHSRTTGINLAPPPGVMTKAQYVAYVKSGRGRSLTGQPHVAGVYGGARRDPWEAKFIRHGGYVPKDLRVLQDLLGTPWIDTERELFEAIPPAYTGWIFDQVRSAGVLRNAA